MVRDIAVVGLGKLGLQPYSPARGTLSLEVNVNLPLVDAVNHGCAPLQEPELQDRIERKASRPGTRGAGAKHMKAGSMTSFRRLIRAALTGRQLRERTTGQKAAMLKEREQQLSRLLATPDFFPAEIDIQRDVMVFIQTSRASLYRLSFLDNRFVRTRPDSPSVGMTKLLSQCAKMQGKKRPLHFILHGAFCGSTLMARHFEELPHCFVLKEPGLLAQLARLKNGTSEPVASEPPLWAEWFEVTMALLARAYASDTAVIIKPNDVCNWMGGLLLDHDRRTKIIFLSSPLKMFLLSILKMDDRRKWARGRVRQLKGYLAQVPFLTGVTVEDLSDSQCCAALWLLNSFLCSSFVARAGLSRIRPLNSEDLIRYPKESLREAADFFGLTSDEANNTALTTLRPLPYHAKHLHLPYDAMVRAVDRDNAEVRFGNEAEEAIAWAEQMSLGWLSESPFPIA
jgi:hypothetical protein